MQVRIKKGAQELAVSEKAFNAIYREKGFSVVEGGNAESSTGEEAKDKRKGGKGKTAKTGAEGHKAES